MLNQENTANVSRTSRSTHLSNTLESDAQNHVETRANDTDLSTKVEACDLSSRWQVWAAGYGPFNRRENNKRGESPAEFILHHDYVLTPTLCSIEDSPRP